MANVVRGRGGETRAATPLQVQRFKDREVFTSNGRYGKIHNVVLGEDGQPRAVVDFGSEIGRHQVPLSSFAYENNRFVIREGDVAALPAYTDGQRGLRLLEPGAALNIAGYWAEGDDDSTIYVQNTAPQVTVQRPTLEIDWEQPPPHVTVHQPTPHVNVRQAQPVIIVRQPPPRITVEIDQPEIIVRMPDPEVDVSVAEPQVQVSMQDPQVQVLQPDQPRVHVRASQPQVSLVPRGKPDVAIERGQPQVQYERMGEPQLIAKQMNGGPRIRVEQMSREEAMRTAAPATLQSARLEGRKLFSHDGDELGKIERVLIGRDGRHFVVLSQAGLLGFKDRRVLLPISDLAMSGDRLSLFEKTLADVGRIDAWDEDMARFTRAAADTPVRFMH
ncbi:MAG: PRC-barrel domain-containing protein [Vitreimonas sp.]